jgi:SAM-dependent methyltransferase
MMERSWINKQTNAALQSEHDVSRAYVEMLPFGLPYHKERWKNWDVALALHHTYDTTRFDQPVLDAGACRDPKYPSPYLPGLQRFGYQLLSGCNLDEGRTEYEQGIRYEHGDITRLRHGKGHFAFVACLSVIEHGVKTHLFLEEMARVIQPNGHLFVSFDYWQDPIDTGDRTAFGVPVKIFNRADVVGMVHFAEHHGFELTGELELGCKDRVVNWLGLEYTFFNLLFRRR